MKWLLQLTFLVGISSLFGFTAQEALDRVSFKEKIHMRCFARKFLESDHASHVLFFDNKAVCSGGCILKGRDKTVEDELYAKGWQAFKKNEHLFPHPNFLFDTSLSEDDGRCGYYKILGIHIINKCSLAKCLNRHLSLFKKILGSAFDSDQFITALEKGSPLRSLINHDELLLGVLLGYGEESSQSFRNAQHNQEGTSPPSWKEDYCRIHLKRPNGCKVQPLAFMGNPSSIEVQSLVTTYERELDVFWNIYKKEDPLLLFLKCICKENLQSGAKDFCQAHVK